MLSGQPHRSDAPFFVTQTRMDVMNGKMEQAKKILMTKLDVNEKEAVNRISHLASLKNLDTDKTCDVIIQLENIVSEKWFASTA
jgi:AmiR/NasT family two-component response regulator